MNATWYFEKGFILAITFSLSDGRGRYFMTNAVGERLGAGWVGRWWSRAGGGLVEGLARVVGVSPDNWPPIHADSRRSDVVCVGCGGFGTSIFGQERQFRAGGRWMAAGAKEWTSIGTTIVISEVTMLTTKRRPVGVGEILVEEFLKPMGLTQSSLAEAMGVQRKHVNEMCNDRRTVTASTALILAGVFGNTPEFWLDVQRRSDLWDAMHSPAEVKRIKRAKPLRRAA